MKFISIILLSVICPSVATNSVENKDNIALRGKTGPEIVILFPLANDVDLIDTTYPIVYPLLVINNLQIKDEKKINCFRNYFDRKNIKNIKYIKKSEAQKIGIANIPKDGVLFITTKKGYYFDLSCE